MTFFLDSWVTEDEVHRLTWALSAWLLCGWWGKWQVNKMDFVILLHFNKILRKGVGQLNNKKAPSRYWERMYFLKLIKKPGVVEQASISQGSTEVHGRVSVWGWVWGWSWRGTHWQSSTGMYWLLSHHTGQIICCFVLFEPVSYYVALAGLDAVIYVDQAGLQQADTHLLLPSEYICHGLCLQKQRTLDSTGPLPLPYGSQAWTQASTLNPLSSPNSPFPVSF